MHESRAGPLSWTILLKLIYPKKKKKMQAVSEKLFPSVRSQIRWKIYKDY